MTSNEASKKTQKESKSTSKPINSNSKPERSRSKPSNSINKLEKSINEPINSSSRPKNSSRKLRKSSSKPEIKPKPIIKNRVRTAKALKEESSGDKSSELSNESAQKGQAKKKGAAAVARPAKESDREEECMRQKLSESSGQLQQAPELCWTRMETGFSALLSVKRLKLQENDAREVSFVIETYDEEDSESDSSSERSFLLVEQVMTTTSKFPLLVCSVCIITIVDIAASRSGSQNKLGEAVVPSKLMIRYSALQCDKRKVLGTGNFGQVSEGKLKLFSRMQRGMYMELDVAVKSSEEGQFNEPIRSEFRRKIVREASTMKELDGCVNVSLILGVCYDTPCIDVAVELCPGGSLYSHLLKFTKRISLEERLYFMNEYIHKNKYYIEIWLRGTASYQMMEELRLLTLGCLAKYPTSPTKSWMPKFHERLLDGCRPKQLPHLHSSLISLTCGHLACACTKFSIMVQSRGLEWMHSKSKSSFKLIECLLFEDARRVSSFLNQCWMLDRSLRPDFISIYRRLKKERKSVKNDELRVKRSRFTIFLIKGVYCRSKEEMFRSDAYFRSVRLFDAKMSSRKEAESQGSTKKKSTNSSDDM
uniref:Protein kinase domain-containing protein n=1 Tax=Ditylenchus dipsaci TaxID=166011 RepID=A0A915CS59_9BILA